MAAVVFELLNNENKQSWRDIEIEVVPGVTAMQTLAARVGAPLGHDFCAISLSDLLTSWTVIEKRILAAAQGDFVVSFYNPVSRNRDWQLDRAKEVLLDYRAPSTPVILGRNLTRDNESIVVTHLEKLRSSDVDMLTIVMVGSSTSVAFQHNQKLCVYTPRGYEKKYDIKCKDEHPADVSAKFTTPLSI
jgi:precorrin-3B C17-methyltransferase